VNTKQLAKSVASGERSSLARAITLVENNEEEAVLLLDLLAKKTGGGFVLGVTGPPGTGKSTLVDRLISAYRAKGLKVGVVAIDPTSPISGGALLGDRIRMMSHATDQGVYIRSMASRGWSGGLARSTAQVVQLMDAAGMDVILIETAGIGQSDIEVVGIAHAVMVVFMPGMGDDIQVLKAGLMEIGDIYVVNKSDIEGADLMVINIMSLAGNTKSRAPVVLKVSALKGEGLDGLVESIEQLRAKFSEGSSGLRIRSVRGMILELAKSNILEDFKRTSESRVDKLALEVLNGKLTVNDAARRLSK
jgi:LAO/AO transport system kinase